MKRMCSTAMAMATLFSMTTPSVWAESLIRNVRQLTFEGKRSGEGYFSADGTKMIFQSEREPGNPFFQIYWMDLNTGDTRRISPGKGKTTCAWIHPQGNRVLFASTHENPDAKSKQDAEIARRQSGKTRRYTWDYDEYYDLFEARPDGTILENLTHARGYDAEGSYSPDGSMIAFSSNRHAYEDDLSEVDRQKLQSDPSTFLEIYSMKSDGTHVTRLTDVPGYDGGPFFSPDGKRICWRRFSPEGPPAEVWTMNVNGTDARRLTSLGAISWAPFYHPSGEYLIFASNTPDPSNFELYMIDTHARRQPVKVTSHPAFDSLAAFSPDGSTLAWTSNRTTDDTSQIFTAQWNHQQAIELLGLASDQIEMSAEEMTAALSTAVRNAATAIDADSINRIATILARYGDIYAGGTLDHQDHRAISTTLLPTFASAGLQPLGGSSFNDVYRESGTSIYLARLSGGSNLPAPVLLAASVPVSPTGQLRGWDAPATLLSVAANLSNQARTGKLALQRDLIVALVLGDLNSASIVKAVYEKAELSPSQRLAAVIELVQLPQDSATVVIHGTETSPIWPREIERRNVPVGLKLDPRPAPSTRSAAMKYYQREFPVITITGSDGSMMHNAEPQGAEIARLVSLLTRSLLMSPETPEFTPIEKRADAQSGRPYLGTEPDYAFKESPGVRLSGVAENSPAADAGLRAGDIIVMLKGKPITDIHAYAAALDELQPEEKVLLQAQRGNETIEVTITVGIRK